MDRVETWLQQLHDESGSDLFVTCDAAPMLKVNGVIRPLQDQPLTADETEDLVYGLMNTIQREEFRKTHECQFAVALDEVARFRVSAFHQQTRVGMVCRRIETRIPTFEELGLPEILAELAMAKRGIVMCVGATGTGKSTTLAAMVGYRNRNLDGHIITIEDPIEYVHQHNKSLITQREVGVDTESFEIGLKNTLRQAPDVIMIGEIRTLEAMEHALAFAETGHLVLCTLHANNSNQAMDRIIHFFPEDGREQVFLDLSFNMKAIIAQQLIPSLEGDRRWAAVEILLNTPLVEEKIRNGDIHEIKGIMKDSNHHGMVTFDQCLFRMFKSGMISYDDAIRYADSANEVRLQVKLSEGGSAESLAKNLDGIGLVEQE
jgi:twitching motility protein PilU